MLFERAGTEIRLVRKGEKSPTTPADVERISYLSGEREGEMATIVLPKARINLAWFNLSAVLPFNLRPQDFEMAMRDVYDFLHDTNTFLVNKGLLRLDDTLRSANMSGFLSDMLTDSLAKHARNMARNAYHNGHPDLLVGGVYPNNSVKSGRDGVEIKATGKKGGAVDTHGARDQYMCVFVYRLDRDPNKPAQARAPLEFYQIFLFGVTVADFRNNPRGTLGTRTSTLLHKEGIKKLRDNWVYREDP
jgi:hypothetical protein